MKLMVNRIVSLVITGFALPLLASTQVNSSSSLSPQGTGALICNLPSHNVFGYEYCPASTLQGVLGGISAVDLRQSGDQNLLLNAMADLHAGLLVREVKSVPGHAPLTWIRGITNPYFFNIPAFVVDGARIDNSFSLYLFNDYNHPDDLLRINALNVEDVASVDIIENPADLALLGNHGGHGAIVVTTRKGTTVKPKISYTHTHRYDESVKGFDRQSIYSQGFDGDFGWYWSSWAQDPVSQVRNYQGLTPAELAKLPPFTDSANVWRYPDGSLVTAWDGADTGRVMYDKNWRSLFSPKWTTRDSVDVSGLFQHGDYYSS